jgi:acyl carrier protein
MITLFSPQNPHNMKKEEIKERVKKVIARVLHADVSEISDDANFIFDLGADSFKSVQLIAGFEEEFDIEMDEDKAKEVQTVSGAIDFIAEYLK